MTNIYLQEYQTSDPLPISKDEVPAIRQRFRSRKGGSLLAEVIYDLDGIKIRASSQVGYIPVRDDLQLIVMPKIKSFDDFFYVLEKAGLIPSTFLDHSIFASIGGSERDKPPAFLIDALLYKLRLLKRDGFYRRSVALSEQRTSVKGKIEVSQTIRSYLAKGNDYQVQCNYFDLTSNTVENRFIKYTLWLILHMKGPSRETVASAKEFWRLFSKIPLATKERFSKPIERMILKREVPGGRSYYLDILSLCFLIVNNTTVVVKEGEDIRLSAFVIDMNRTFENYIRNIITTALYPDFKVLNGNEVANKQPLFQNVLHPQITPDIIICNRNSQREFILVGDTKYKRQAKPSDDDWYQIISYTTALHVSTGVLVYPTEQPRPPEVYEINDRVIWVYYFPLHLPKTQEKGLIDFLRQKLVKSL